jgi:hypothetical protein
MMAVKGAMTLAIRMLSIGENIIRAVLSAAECTSGLCLRLRWT